MMTVLYFLYINKVDRNIISIFISKYLLIFNYKYFKNYLKYCFKDLRRIIQLFKKRIRIFKNI